MKFLVYKADDGSFVGWYDDQIHKIIPTPNIQISEADYHSYYDTMCEGKWLVIKNNEVTFIDPIAPPPTWDEIRNQRNYLLDKSDYTQLADAALTPEKQQEWKDYRQTLRTLPETYQTPDQVVWPTPPA